MDLIDSAAAAAAGAARADAARAEMRAYIASANSRPLLQGYFMFPSRIKAALPKDEVERFEQELRAEIDRHRIFYFLQVDPGDEITTVFGPVPSLVGAVALLDFGAGRRLDAVVQHGSGAPRLLA